METFNHQDLFGSQSQYLAWREQKLKWLEQRPEVVEPIQLDTAARIQPAARQSILDTVNRFGFALYALPESLVADKRWLLQFGQQFGLNRLDSNLCADEDSITSLRVVASGQRKTYIPYSNRPINWHTDGYYNQEPQNIRAFILHCVSPAATGGENGLMDPELAYIRLRDTHPDYVRALAHPHVMSIPPNTEGGTEIRGWTAGPVFSRDPKTQRLHMRYTARQRNIKWLEDPLTQEAVACLREILHDANRDIVWHRLKAGEGVLSNNALHCRKGFDDSKERQRLYYRARYYDWITAE